MYHHSHFTDGEAVIGHTARSQLEPHLWLLLPHPPCISLLKPAMGLEVPCSDRGLGVRGEGGASGRFSKNSWDLQDTWPSPCLLQKLRLRK